MKKTAEAALLRKAKRDRFIRRVKCFFGRHEWRVCKFQPLNMSYWECCWECDVCKKHAVGAWPKLGNADWM